MSRQSSVVSRQSSEVSRLGGEEPGRKRLSLTTDDRNLSTGNRRLCLTTDDCKLSTERGFTLAGLLVVLTVLAVVLAFTVPTKWSDVRNRERDRQLMFVLEQYARSIQEYQRRTGGVPTTLEQLDEFNNPRVLRQLYPNPLSGEVDWILVPPGTEAGPGPGGQENPNQPERPGNVTPGNQKKPQRPGGGSDGEYVGPFVGVRPPQTGESILEFNGSNRYEEWIFTVQDLEEQAGTAGQQNPNVPPPTTDTGN